MEVKLDSIIEGDAISVGDYLPAKMFHAIITSPPYYKTRVYDGNVIGQLGQEGSAKKYVENLTEIFASLRHSLRDDGTLWIVIGEKYLKSKAQRIASKLTDALENDGWHFEEEIIWYKNNIMTSSYKNRFIIDYEKILFFTNNKKYHFQCQYEPYSEETIKQFGDIYNGQAVKDYKAAGAPNASETKRNILKSLPRKMPPIGGVKNVGQSSTYTGAMPEFNFGRGRLMRATWQMNTQQYHGAHFAVYPIPLAERIIHSAVPYKYCTICGRAMRPVYSEWKIATRPGNTKRDSKSGTDIDPHKGLHNSELSRKRLKFMRYLTGYEKQCGHDLFAHGVVLDPFIGVGSTAIAALTNGRHYVGIEISPKYIRLANERIALPKYSKHYFDFVSDT